MAWIMGEDGFPTNTDFIAIPEKAMQRPFPDALWRIDADVNDGFPYNKLIPGMLPRPIVLTPLIREHVIRVYDMSEQQDGFHGNGLAILSPTYCVSEKELNGRWDVELTHPLDDWGRWRHLTAQNILKIDGQLFRIDDQKPVIDENSAEITVHAKHIWYDLSDRLVLKCRGRAGNGNGFISLVGRYTLDLSEGFDEYRFTGTSDIRPEQPIELDLHGISQAAAFLGDDSSLVNRLGGELYRDNFRWSVNERMEGASERAFYIRYGSEMTAFSPQVSYEELCTFLRCEDNFGNMWSVSYVSGSYPLHHHKARFASFSYSEKDMQRLMDDGFALWMQISTPKVSFEIETASLRDDPVYSDFIGLQDCDVGDRGTIYCEPLATTTEQEIVSVRRDHLTGDCLKMTLGSFNPSLIRPKYKAGTITSGTSAAEKELRAVREALFASDTRQMSASISGMETFTIYDLEERTINALEGK